jgi:hypothetical protein
LLQKAQNLKRKKPLRFHAGQRPRWGVKTRKIRKLTISRFEPGGAPKTQDRLWQAGRLGRPREILFGRSFMSAGGF